MVSLYAESRFYASADMALELKVFVSHLTLDGARTLVRLAGLDASDAVESEAESEGGGESALPEAQSPQDWYVEAQVTSGGLVAPGGARATRQRPRRTAVPLARAAVRRAAAPACT